jgi:hypothetical protein
MKPLRSFILITTFAALAAAQNYSADVLALNPLGYWQLANNTGDTSSHGASLNGAGITFVSPNGPPSGGGSVGFTGGTQFLTLTVAQSTNFNFSTSSKFTAMAWVKTTGQVLGSMPVMGKFDPNTGNGWALVVDNGGNNGIVSSLTLGSGRVAFGFFVGGNPILTIESGAPINDGNWHLVAGSSDGTGQASGLHIYIDGNPAFTTTVASSGAGSPTNSAPFGIGNIPDGTIPFEGNIAGAAVFNSALTPAQILQLGQDAPFARTILSQFAFGGGWYSAVYFTNNALGTVSFTVNFTSDLGTPLIIPSLNSGSTVVTLAPGASTIIEGISSGNLQQGYVTTLLPPNVTGYGLFRQSQAGVPDQEAVVPLAGTNFGNAFFTYDESPGIATAFALVNSINVPITVTITVTDNSGNVVGTATLPSLPPGNKIENVLSAYIPQITGTRGSVHFASPQSGMSVLGLRFRGSAFTSIPALSGRQLGLYIGVQ